MLYLTYLENSHSSKKDSAIPDFVRQWFDALLPIGLVIFSGFIVVQVLNVNLYQIITGFFMPLQSILNTWYGFILSGMIYCFVYSMGISSWVLTPATEPDKISNNCTKPSFSNSWNRYSCKYGYVY